MVSDANTFFQKKIGDLKNKLALTPKETQVNEESQPDFHKRQSNFLSQLYMGSGQFKSANLQTESNVLFAKKLSNNQNPSNILDLKLN